MKTKSFLYLAWVLLASVILSACQAQMPAAAAAAAPALAAEASAQDPTQTPAPTLSPTAPAATPVAEDGKAQGNEAAQAAQAYFSAVSEGDSAAAADQLSSFSLMVFQMTRGDAVDALQAQKLAGVRWSDFKVLDTRPFDAQTILIHVTYAEKGKAAPTPTAAPKASAKASPTPPAAATAVDALWPMRLERGEWRYNWANVIDFRTLDGEAQTVSGITVLPLQLTRFSDRIQLSMLVQNRTSEAVVFGQVNETLGTFHFGDQAVVAEKTRWILNPLRSVPSATLEVKGLFANFPDTVEIRKWNNYNVKPWYVFPLQ